MRKISITEGLNELKLFDARINKAIAGAQFCGTSKKSTQKVGHMDREEFEKRAKASYQSVTDLIANRNELKSLIVKSNAITPVEVSGKTMTVAEAIERKNSIKYEKALLNVMKAQYATAITTVNRENKKVDEKVDELLITLAGKDSDRKITKEEQENLTKPYREKNEWEFVDPVKMLDEMQNLEEEIDAFEAEVDSKLSIINATTFVELSF